MCRRTKTTRLKSRQSPKHSAASRDAEVKASEASRGPLARTRAGICIGIAPARPLAFAHPFARSLALVGEFRGDNCNNCRASYCSSTWRRASAGVRGPCIWNKRPLDSRLIVPFWELLPTPSHGLLHTRVAHVRPAVAWLHNFTPVFHPRKPRPPASKRVLVLRAPLCACSRRQTPNRRPTLGRRVSLCRSNLSWRLVCGPPNLTTLSWRTRDENETITDSFIRDCPYCLAGEGQWAGGLSRPLLPFQDTLQCKAIVRARRVWMY